MQRKHDLRAVFNAVRYLAHTGVPWRYLPSDFPPWPVVYQQLRRWLAASSFEALVHDTRLLLRTLKGRSSQPSAVILDARVLQSTPESGSRAGYSGHKRRKGSKVHAAVDTLGYPLALSVTPASEDERDAGAGVDGAGPSGHRRTRRDRLCGPGLHRSRSRGQRRGARHRVGRRQDARGQTRLRSSAQTLGRRENPVTVPTIRS